MDDHKIKIQAYGPLSPLFRFPGGPIDEVVSRIAGERKVTEAQVMLAWAKQHSDGIIVTYVFHKSCGAGYLAENLLRQNFSK